MQSPFCRVHVHQARAQLDSVIRKSREWQNEVYMAAMPPKMLLGSGARIASKSNLHHSNVVTSQCCPPTIVTDNLIEHLAGEEGWALSRAIALRDLRDRRGRDRDPRQHQIAALCVRACDG